eukprot:COSAG02_NODE_8312_length_2620_cov_7.600952_2_plen_40_part_00
MDDLRLFCEDVGFVEAHMKGWMNNGRVIVIVWQRIVNVK